MSELSVLKFSPHFYDEMSNCTESHCTESHIKNIYSSGYSFTPKALMFWLDKKVTDAPMIHCNNSVQQVAGIVGVVLLKAELVRATFTQSPCRNNQHSTEVIRHKCSCHQSRDGGEGEERGGSHSEQRSQQIVPGVESEVGLMQIWTCLLPGGNLNHPHVFFGGGKDPHLHQVA